MSKSTKFTITYGPPKGSKWTFVCQEVTRVNILHTLEELRYEYEYSSFTVTSVKYDTYGSYTIRLEYMGVINFDNLRADIDRDIGFHDNE